MSEENKTSTEAKKLEEVDVTNTDESKSEKLSIDKDEGSKEDLASPTIVDSESKSEATKNDEKDQKESEVETKEEKKELEKETEKDTVVDDDDKPLSQIKKDIQNKPTKSEDKPPSPPPKPPRPLSPFSQNHLTLSEAFPTVEPNVVRAVLIASSGLVDPAFNGLLSLTDPDYKIDEELLQQQQQTTYTQLSNILKSHHRPPPPGFKTALRKPGQAPRYRQQHPTGGQALNAKRVAQQASAATTIRTSSAQIEDDEKLARILAAKYDAEQRGERRVRYADTGRGTTYTDPSIDNTSSRKVGRGRRTQENSGYGYEGGGPDAYQEDDGYAYDYDYEDDDDMYKDRSFFDDELPQIKENLAKGFNETKEKMNSWVENLRKKIDGDDKQPGVFSGIFNNNKGVFGGLNSFASGSEGSKNNSRQRPGKYYDQDPEEINFSGINMKDETNPRLPPRPDRKPTVVGGNNVSNTSNDSDSNSKWEPLQSASPNRMDSLNPDKSDTTTAKETGTKSSSTANSKKIPLKSDTTEDDDPFFIGDSDDEDEDNKTTKK